MAAPSLCAVDRCPNVAVRRGRCEQHAPKAWATGAGGRDARGVLRGRALGRVRARKIRAAGGRCQQCGRRDLPLELHHLADLADYSQTVVLCSACHELRRASKRRAQRAAAEHRRRSGLVAGNDTSEA
jgi:5-methylcytosine-specific restriction protein A